MKQKEEWAKHFSESIGTTREHAWLAGFNFAKQEIEKRIIQKNCGIIPISLEDLQSIGESETTGRCGKNNTHF